MKKLFLSLTVSAASLVVHADESMIAKQDFASLFNQFRFAQPEAVPWAGSYFAYKTGGIAMGIEGGIGYTGLPEKSASFYYDNLYNDGQLKAHEFELKNHSCENVDESLKEGCEGWWGHCNGWAAAAIKETEPRKSVEVRGKTLEVGHQKALVTELWLTSNSGFMGDTQKEVETGAWVYNTNDPHSRSFWDVTPRQAFLAFTNQVGVNKIGVVIDRFTGDQVWNQPVVGYRILPIRSRDLGTQEFNGKPFYYANIRMKIYWANDNVQPGHLSSGFQIDRTSDAENIDLISKDYDQRLLKFKLYFDAPVVMDSTGTKVQSAGRLVGEGLWDLQEHPTENLSMLNHGHPDFIWLPQSAYIDYSRGYGNPYIGKSEIREVAMASRGESVSPILRPRPAPATPPTPAPAPATPPPAAPAPSVSATAFEIEIERANFYEGSNMLVVEKLLERIFSRANLAIDVDQENVRFSGSRIVFRILSADAISAKDIRDSLEDAGTKVIRINSVQ